MEEMQEFRTIEMISLYANKQMTKSWRLKTTHLEGSTIETRRTNFLVNALYISL